MANDIHGRSNTGSNHTMKGVVDYHNVKPLTQVLRSDSWFFYHRYLLIYDNFFRKNVDSVRKYFGMNDSFVYLNSNMSILY